MTTETRQAYRDPGAGGAKYNVLVTEKDDWVVFHAQAIFVWGCLFPPIWIMLWVKALKLISESWTNTPREIPNQVIHFDLMKHYQSASYPNAKMVTIDEEDDQTMTSVCYIHLSPWIGRSFSGVIFYFGIGVLLYGLFA